MPRPADTTVPATEISNALERNQREQQRYARRAQERRNFIADDSPNEIVMITNTDDVSFPHRTLQEQLYTQMQADVFEALQANNTSTTSQPQTWIPSQEQILDHYQSSQSTERSNATTQITD